MDYRQNIKDINIKNNKLFNKNIKDINIKNNKLFNKNIVISMNVEKNNK